MMKRILILFVVFSLLICPFDVSGAEDTAADNDMYNNFKNSESVQLLSALGVISGADDGDVFVSRQQFVDYVAKMLKINHTATEKVFKDVEAESVVHTFAKLNYLKVGADKEFRPADIITYSEACIVLVRVLGYEDYICAQGGSVSEYMRFARQLGVEINKSIGDSLTALDVFELLTDTLNARIFETVAIGKGAEYEQTETLLKRIYGIYQIKGVFNANEWTSVYKDVVAPGEGRIVINKTILDAKNTQYARPMMLGRCVKAYVKESKDALLPEVVLVIEDDKNTDVYTFPTKDFIGAKGNEISFYVGNKEKTIALGYPTLIYNGEADFDAAISEIVGLFNNDNTKITLVKNNAERADAIVFVDEYTNAEVTSVDTTGGYIYARDGLDNTYKIQTVPNGQTSKVCIKDLQTTADVNLTDISRGDIIFFGISRSQNVVTIYHCTKTIQGKVEGLAVSGGDGYATIDGKKYTIINNPLGRQIDIGLFATFYFGLNGEIIAIKDVQDVWQTGYLYHIIPVDEAFSNVQYRFRVFTTDGTVKNLTCAKKYILDGVSKNSDSAFYDRISPDGTVNDKLRLFRYKVNEKGELKNIDTAALLNETPEAEKSLRILGEKLARTFRKDTNSGYMLFEADTTVSGTTITTATGESRGYSYPVNKSTEIFSVPHTPNFEALDRNFTYSTVEKSDHITKDKDATCAFYNTDVNSEYVSLIVNYRNPILDYGKKSNPYLINESGIEIMTEDGDICKALEVITTLAVSTGKLTYTVLLEPEVTFTDIKGNKSVMTDAEVIACLSPGDVIQYGGGVTGKTGSIRILYDYDADDPNSVDDDNRGQVYWGWQDESGNTLPVYTYRYTSAISATNLSVDFSGVYGYLLDSVIDADTQAQDDAYGKTAPSCYAFLGALGAEGNNTIYGSAGWATGYRRLTMYDNNRCQSKAYWGIFTDLVNYRSSQTDYYYVLLFNGSTNQQGNCAVFYKR